MNNYCRSAKVNKCITSQWQALGSTWVYGSVTEQFCEFCLIVKRLPFWTATGWMNGTKKVWLINDYRAIQLISIASFWIIVLSNRIKIRCIDSYVESTVFDQCEVSYRIKWIIICSLAEAKTDILLTKLTRVLCLNIVN